MPSITTMKISTETKERLNHIKEYDRETYNELVNKLFYIINICRKEPLKAQKILENLDKRIKRKIIMKKKIKI
jgi:phosphoribosyl-ATP pyrophosphohydrolase